MNKLEWVDIIINLLQCIDEVRPVWEEVCRVDEDIPFFKVDFASHKAHEGKVDQVHFDGAFRLSAATLQRAVIC